jgi:hypothetical protein
MAGTGYIKDGKYIKAKRAPLSKMVKGMTALFKQGDHARQRFDHSGEILQPYGPDGKPNPKFIEAWPEESIQYGFTPGEFHDPNEGRVPDYYDKDG